MKSKIFKILGVATTVAMLTGMLTVAPALALSTPTVTLGSYKISDATSYAVEFNVAKQLVEGDTITLTLPTGTLVTDGDLSASTVVVGSDGWYDDPATPDYDPVWTPAQFGATTVAGDDTARTVTLTLGIGDVVGSGTYVIIMVDSGITNPGAAGDYTLSVKTSQETTAVPSAAYTIEPPTFYPLPGVISVFNSDGVQIDLAQGAGELGAVISALTLEDCTIELGPGWYVESAPITVAVDGLTIKASGALADTVVPANWTVNAVDVTFEGLTLKNHYDAGYPNGTTVLTVGAAADNITIDGCFFTRAGTATGTTAETFINYTNTTADGSGTVTGCIFDSTSGAAYDSNLILVASGALGLVISDNTFKLDMETASGYYASDWSIVTYSEVEVVDNTFTGTVGFGKGVKANAGANLVLVEGNSFSGMISAIEMGSSSAKVDFYENTVENCGYADTTGVFKIWAAGNLEVVNNKITGSKYYVCTIYDDYGTFGDDVQFIWNELTGNAYGIYNESTGWVDATHNWWGDAEGPAADHNTDYVDASAPLGAVSSNGEVAWDEDTLKGKTTSGVDITTHDWDGSPESVYQMGSASYASNPAPVELPSDLKLIEYYDVFVFDEPWMNADEYRIKFYGAVNAFCQVWYYNAGQMEWKECSDYDVLEAAGYVRVIVNWDYTVPAIGEDMWGAPFALVEAPPEAPEEAWIDQSPALGAMNVPINTSFTWPAVSGAVEYTIEIAKESGQTAENKFYLKDFTGSSTVNAYKPADSLLYDTQYWWRVRAINDLGVAGSWTTAFFTTEAEPPEEPEPVPPVEIVQGEAPVINLEIPPAQEVKPIPDYLLWLVIAIGAVLVVAVIVLIVRTRRIS